MWRMLWEQYAPNIQWPERQEWIQMQNKWPELSAAVGVIDGTVHKIYRPMENQAHYYSGHRHVHCVITQIIIDNNKCIRYIKAGFKGHNNDATCYNLMPRIGIEQELDFPSDCFLLADKIYPSQAPILKPYTVQQVAREPQERIRRKMRKLNRKIRSRQVYVEHVIGALKNYRVLSSLYTYRHLRGYTTSIVELCAGLAVRSAELM
jgi:hypothetical protein